MVAVPPPPWSCQYWRARAWRRVLQGVAGVPLYLWYAPGAAEPQRLPQVLTPGSIETLARGTNGNSAAPPAGTSR